nr:immunoglobulin heavy chain junction region [Mus musculus]
EMVTHTGTSMSGAQ